MVASQNGWRANDPTVVSRRTVPGTTVGITVHNGPSGDLLLEVAAQFDRYVQDIDNGRGTLDDWGYAERPIRDSLTVISNHASGTAIDLNALKWPLGSLPSVNLNPTQIQTVRQIVAKTGGVVRWGGDYTGRKDPMHFEINDGQDEADCQRALAALRGTSPTPSPNSPIWTDGTYCQYGDRNDRVMKIHEFMTRVYPKYNQYTPTGFYGDATKKGIATFQANSGITGPGSDGTIIGPKTMTKLMQAGFRP